MEITKRSKAKIPEAELKARIDKVVRANQRFLQPSHDPSTGNPVLLMQENGLDVMRRCLAREFGLEDMYFGTARIIADIELLTRITHYNKI